ncbi:hypothetical protein GWI33_014862 [Rhynchophorus ferrugineus]|uniref:C2H2-type domain-containing protein n=1 Tax=Rhynchophorus ferrugineus TaxID=354439 RepID=A0A834I4W9_RHYFE|nr:hypothetical protein GWI33_014862 [Rhynchophorus ferrugineus]
MSAINKLGIKYSVEYGKPFGCSKCGKRYKRKIHLNSHLKYECGVRPQFVCELCSRAFHQKSNLKAHINVVHFKMKRSSQGQTQYNNSSDAEDTTIMDVFYE